MIKFQAHSLLGMDDEIFFRDFLAFPKKVRAKEYQAGMASDEQTKKLMGWGLAHGSSFWLIKNMDGKTLLRLSARPCPHLPGEGTIGYFEMDLKDPEIKEAFLFALNEATQWLRSKSVTKITAPVDINTWFNYRFSTEGKHFFPRLSWEPTTPPEYHAFFKEHGFEDLAYFHTVFFPHFRIGSWCLGTGPMKRSYKNIHDLGFRLRPFDMENFMEKEVPLFHEISHEAFSDSLLFEPIDLQTFSAMYASALKTYDFTPSSVLLGPEGEVAGFIFAFYDGDYLVIKSLAIKKKYQGLKLSSGMIFNAVRQAFVKNKKGTISALVRTGLASETIEKNVKKTMWFSWSHYYVLLKKDLL